ATHNRQVAGSNPARATITYRH
ncbi:putative envelope protein, partial [Escherichia coli EC1846]